MCKLIVHGDFCTPCTDVDMPIIIIFNMTDAMAAEPLHLAASCEANKRSILELLCAELMCCSMIVPEHAILILLQHLICQTKTENKRQLIVVP